MRTNAAGLKIIKDAEGLRLKSSSARLCSLAGVPRIAAVDSALSICNFVNKGCADAKPLGNLTRRKIVVVKHSNGMSLQVSQLGTSSKFPPQVDKPTFPLAAGILDKCNPFKVAWHIINFVPVKMINGRAVKIAGHKSLCDKAMNAVLCALASNHDCNLKVTVPSYVRTKNLALPDLRKRSLNRVVSHSSINSGLPRQSANSTKVADLKELGGNFAKAPYLCVFHSSVYTRRALVGQAA